MPTTTSAKKRHRQSLKRRERNRAVKSLLKTQLRKTREAADAKQAEPAQTNFKVTAKKLDQAAAKGIIHPNKASRLKSRLSKALKRAGIPQAK